MDSFGDISRMDLSEIDKPVTGDQEAEQDTTVDREDALENTLDDAENSTDLNSNVEEAEIAAGPKKMMEPEGRFYKIDAEITSKEVTAFLFGHNYRQPIMLMATVIGVAWPILSLITGNGNLMMGLVSAAVFLIFFPLSTWNKGRNAKKLNPAYEKVFYYMLDEWGLHLELGEDAIDVEWRRIYKYMFLKSVVVLYTGRSNAFLIPTDAMGEKKEEIIAFMKEMKKKNR